MKQHCTFVTTDIDSSYGGYPTFDHLSDWVNAGEPVLTSLKRQGWTVLSAMVCPVLSTQSARPQFAFILERDEPSKKDGPPQ